MNVTPRQVNLDPNFNGFNTGVNSFVIDPTNTATIYLGTCTQGIYKTTDCGANWTHINTGTNGALLDAGRTWTMAIDPVEPNVLYANSGYGQPGLFKSSNGGVDWVQLFPTGSEWDTYVDYAFVEFVAMDPSDHRHLIISSHAQCHGPVEGDTCMAESLDSGATWRLFRSDPRMGYEAVGLAIVNRRTWIAFQPFHGVLLTQDAGATWTLPGMGSANNQSGELYRADDGTYYIASFNGLWRSPDAVSWRRTEAPRMFSVTGDGTRLFSSLNENGVQTPYFTSTGDMNTWTPYQAPSMPKGSWLMRYDRDHSLLYTSNEAGGFWRVKTK